jgi:hypothetical protein
MSDNDEDSMPIAATLTKATKTKKPAKGLTSFSSSLLHEYIFAFLLHPIAKRQRWFYEPVVDGKSPYWDGPVSHAAVDVPVRMALVDGYVSAVIEGNPNELGATKEISRRPMQMMSEREADEMAQHGEVLRWSPTINYVTTGLSFYYNLVLLFLASVHNIFSFYSSFRR